MEESYFNSFVSQNAESSWFLFYKSTMPRYHSKYGWVPKCKPNVRIWNQSYLLANWIVKYVHGLFYNPCLLPRLWTHDIWCLFTHRLPVPSQKHLLPPKSRWFVFCPRHLFLEFLGKPHAFLFGRFCKHAVWVKLMSGQGHGLTGIFLSLKALSFWIHFQEGTTVDASEIRRSPIDTKVQKMTNPHIQKTTTGYLELKRTSPDELFFRISYIYTYLLGFFPTRECPAMSFVFHMKGMTWKEQCSP